MSTWTPLSYKQLTPILPDDQVLHLTVSPEEKVVIFSDTHLSSEYDQILYKKIVTLLQHTDRVIINGDFWDSFDCTFDEFIHSQWASLFPLLREKNAIYLFGNHDMPVVCDQRVSLFCVQTGFRVKIESGSLRVHVEHGQLLSGLIVGTVLSVFETRPRLLARLTAPVSFIEHSVRSLWSNDNILFRHVNAGFQKKRLSVSSPEEYFVMGHTHIPTEDEKNRFLNDGYCHNGHFSYVLIGDENVSLRFDD